MGGDEGDEGDEGLRGAAVEERDHRRARGFVGREEEGGEGGDGGPDGDRPGDAEVCGEVHPPRDHDDQVAEEESDQGREADGLREGGLREGEARSDPGEVLRREGAEGQLLSWEVCLCVPLSQVPGGAKTPSWRVCSGMWGHLTVRPSDGRAMPRTRWWTPMDFLVQAYVAEVVTTGKK